MSSELKIDMALRIPGNWSHPREVIDNLPEDYRIDDDGLIDGKGNRYVCYPAAADSQFPQIFLTGTRSEWTQAEVGRLQKYHANIIVAGPAGSISAAIDLMKAGSAIVKAGGMGVFIDNSCISHSASDWIEMTTVETPESISFGLIGVIRGAPNVYTMGMNMIGQPDILIPKKDVEESDGKELTELICHVFRDNVNLHPGLVLSGVSGRRFRMEEFEADDIPADSLMHNKHGRVKLVRISNLGELN